MKPSEVDDCCRKASGYTGDDFGEELCPDIPTEDMQKYVRFKFCQSDADQAQFPTRNIPTPKVDPDTVFDGE